MASQLPAMHNGSASAEALSITATDTRLVPKCSSCTYYVAYPFAGSGDCCNAKDIAWAAAIRTLMQRMRIAALYCKPRISARHP